MLCILSGLESNLHYRAYVCMCVCVYVSVFVCVCVCVCNYYIVSPRVIIKAIIINNQCHLLFLQWMREHSRLPHSVSALVEIFFGTLSQGHDTFEALSKELVDSCWASLAVAVGLAPRSCDERC